ncbi:MAG TPA: PIN domain-containing protein [Burkholderiaceae bacterium]|nr:PIN domain-containing protein [Burkholderiaceae bacterium]
MSAVERFFDTNVLLYLLSSDTGKADRAEQILSLGGAINVQVLNEFASVSLRILGMSVEEVREVLATVRGVCTVVPLGLEVHELGLQVLEKYRLSLYDAMIVAAAVLVGCKTLVSEDLQHGQVFEGRLQVLNPFL